MAPPPITLKARFSKSSAAASMTPFSIPFNAPISPDSNKSPPVLTSRFSAETLAVKTPRMPSLSHHRWFSSSGSPPPHSPTKGPYTHGTSASESKLNISGPTNVTHGPSDEEEELIGSEGEGAKVVRDVDEAFEFAKGHGRNGSGGSAKKIPLGNKSLPPSPPSRNSIRLSRSVSSPAPPPPRPLRRAPLLPHSQSDLQRPSRSPPPPPLPRSDSLQPRAESRTANYPPRSESRNATHPPRSDSRNGFLPPAPVAKLIAAQTARPHSPPNPINPPLALQGRRIPTPHPPVAPFKATLVSSPSAYHVKRETVRISLDIGGTSFVTTPETLLRDGRGGKLGEFVAAVSKEVEAESKAKVAVEGRSGMRKDSGGSMYAPSEDDAESYLGPDQFDHSPSPFPSPFPFMRYDNLSSSEDEIAAGLTLDADGSIVLPMSPTSPIDPFIKKMLPVAPPSSTPPSIETRTEGQGQLIPSPLPHLRINSFHPPIYGNPPSVTSDDYGQETPSSATSFRLSSASESTHFDTVLEAFQSMRDASPTPSSQRDSIDYPTDIDESSPQEDRSRSTLLGVPRGSMKLKGPRNPRTRPTKPPPVPRLKVHSENETDGSRPPSLSMSDSSVEAEPLLIKTEDVGDGKNVLEVFLDRNGKLYEPIFHFLRDGFLPATHSLPRSTIPTPLNQPDVDATTLSLISLHPPSALVMLGSLRTLSTEASWLGMKELAETCESEMERVVEVVRWLEGKNTKILRDKREKAGWI